MAQFSHLYMTTGKILTLTIQTFVSKVMSLLFFFFSFYRLPRLAFPPGREAAGEGRREPLSLLFNRLSRCVITFLPEASAFNFRVAVTICSEFGAQDNKIFHCFYFFPIYLP